MSRGDYGAAILLAAALLVGVLAASTTLLDAWIDARRRRRLERLEREAYREFLDGRWFR